MKDLLLVVPLLLVIPFSSLNVRPCPCDVTVHSPVANVCLIMRNVFDSSQLISLGDVVLFFDVDSWYDPLLGYSLSLDVAAQHRST